MWRIAHELGYPHPRLMLQQVGASEVTEMIAYYTLFPFGEEREDLRVGYAFALQTNAQRTSKKAKLWGAADFYPKYLEIAAKSQREVEGLESDGWMTGDEMLEVATGLATHFKPKGGRSVSKALKKGSS